MSKNKREMDRHSGTGGSIKGDSKRSGGGQHNWGGDKEAIEDATTAHKVETATDQQATADSKPLPRDDLVAPDADAQAGTEEQKPLDVSYEEYVKQQQRSGNKAYDARTVSTTFRPNRYQGKNYFEKATDELLQGAQKEKKKRKKTRKQQTIIKAEYSFHPASGIPDHRAGGGGGRGRGRGRGRGGEGGFSSNRPYGGGAGGSDRGYSRYGGFGSRGRGRRNDENVDSNMPPQRPQYRLKNEGGDAAAQPPHTTENTNIPPTTS